jgi:cysteine desulfurase
MSASDAVYLDYAATTPVDERVAERMAAYLTVDGDFANPASETHVFGRRARDAVERSREQVAEALGADRREIVFTSGATEANNLALKGSAQFLRDRGRHIVVGATEHKAVLDPADALAFQGFEVTRVPPDAQGRTLAEAVADAMREDTVLVSVMHANNETGVINDIAAIGERVHARGARFHVDAAQTAGKIDLDVRAKDLDLLSLSGHKFYGPKGAGALWVRRRPRVRLFAQIHGGGHERGLRSGTLATHQIVGLGEALALAVDERERDWAHAQRLAERLDRWLTAAGEVVVAGEDVPRLPSTRSLAFPGVDGEALTATLTDGVALATGSACSSGDAEPSYVLRAMGYTAARAAEAVRLSWGRFTTTEAMDRAADRLIDAVTRYRGETRVRA